VPAADLGSEWVPGTRLIVLRRGYRHHVIYVGSGRVIHDAGLTLHRRGCIEEVSLDDFIGNRPIHLGTAPDEARGHDIVLRARSRLGECRYDLLKNNCEHFLQLVSAGRVPKPAGRLTHETDSYDCASGRDLGGLFPRMGTVLLGFSGISFMNVKVPTSDTSFIEKQRRYRLKLCMGSD